MRIPKQYGQSRIDNCPFCGKRAVAKNSQGVPVCQQHKAELLSNLKCACGEYLDVLEGKWGPYFKCINCGNINFRKGLEMNPSFEKPVQEKPIQKKVIEKVSAEKKEIFVTSDEVDFI